MTSSESTRRSVPWALCLALLVACGCGGGADSPFDLLLLAAASTTDVAAELGARFEAGTGNRVRISTGASNALASQVLAGAPGDVFLSANPSWVETLRAQGLSAADRPLLENRLVMVVPGGNPAGLRLPEDLLGPTVRRVALAGEAVPAGQYARQALRHAGVYDRLVRERRVARGHNARVTLSYVEHGEAEAGIVYATDARVSDRVEVVHRFPIESHEPIVYSVALLSTGEAARGLYEFLAGPQAAIIFRHHGFVPASERDRDP